MAKDLQKILASKVTSKNVSSVLGRLFRQILKETGLINSIDSLVDRYEAESELEAKSLGIKPKKRSQIVTQIASEGMSWKIFMDSITNLLRVKKVTICIKLDHGNGRVTIHELPYRAIGDDSMPVEDLKDLKETKENESNWNSY